MDKTATRPPSDWTTSLDNARQGLALLDEARATLNALGDSATAEITRYLRMQSGVDLDPDAIRATLTRPYTLIPISEHEAWLIHWRGIKMPIFGWVVAQEPAFVKARVTRSMDLLTPLPAWMKDELGWKPPEHAAQMDSTRTSLRVTSGDETSFKRRYGAHLGAKQADGSFRIKGGEAWIKLVAQLVRDGILPYTPQPVAPEHWDEQAVSPITLRPYQQTAVAEFRQKGAVLLNLPPGAGKTYITLDILNHFRGRVLLLADTTILVEQWRNRIQRFVPFKGIASGADVTISTYQGAGKYLDRDWDLLIPDEAQRLPANTFSKLAFVKTKYRLGLTGTPWREDDRQFLITALSGFPVSIRWSELIASGVLRKPRIIVATVGNDAAKVAYVKSLVARRRGRTLIFCDWIEQGQALANALEIPFVHGESPHKLQQIESSDVCVVSRIGDRGLDLPDLKLVIEVAGAGKAREQFAQRVGRLLHGQFSGEFYTVFTPDEAERYRSRVFGVEVELAGEVDIEFVTVGNVQERRLTAPVRTRKARPRRTDPTAHVAAPADATAVPSAPTDEIATFLALPPVAKLLAEAQVERPGYLPIVLRACWRARLTSDTIAFALGAASPKTRARIAACANWLTRQKLLVLDKTDRTYTVNHDTVNELRALSDLGRGLR